MFGLHEGRLQVVRSLIQMCLPYCKLFMCKRCFNGNKTSKYSFIHFFRFDNKKGFYCQVMSNGANKCLGRSKGRQYPPMDPMSEEYLHNFYRKHNSELAQLLEKLHVEKPGWLVQEMKLSNGSYKK